MCICLMHTMRVYYMHGRVWLLRWDFLDHFFFFHRLGLPGTTGKTIPKCGGTSLPQVEIQERVMELEMHLRDASPIHIGRLLNKFYRLRLGILIYLKILKPFSTLYHAVDN